MPGVLGQFSNGPIQFDTDTGAIEARGSIDRSQPSAQPTTPMPAPAPSGGGMLPMTPDDGGMEFGDARPFGGAVNGLPMTGGGYTGLPSYGAMTGESFGGGALPFGGGSGQSISYADGGDVSDDDEDDEPETASGATGWDALPQSQNIEDRRQSDPTMQAKAPQGGGVDWKKLMFGSWFGDDPLASIKNALSFGRTQMGLPARFYGSDAGGTKSYDDGGMIPDPDVTADGNNSAPIDPRQTLKYLAGDGAVSPEIADALQRHVDPQGSMDPAQRTLATLMAAPNDEAKFGMMQHYRGLYNGFSAGARAALDKGQAGQAAILASQAFDHVPTGSKVKFAPAPGGIAVMTSQLGDAMRGALSAPPPDNSPAPNETIGGSIRRALTGKKQSFADGGDVEEDYSVAPSVIPEPEQDESISPEDAAPPAAQGDTGQSSEPIVLTPEQFKSLMETGYDRSVDEGVDSLLQNAVAQFNPTVSPTMNPPGSPAAAPQEEHAMPAVRPPAAPAQAAAGPSAALQQQMNTPTPLSQVAAAQAAEQKKKEPVDNRQARYDEELKRTEALADKLFPWASQTAQRNAYVGNHMNEFAKNVAGKIEVDEHSSKRLMAQQAQQNKFNIEQFKELGRNNRQANSAESRERIAAANNVMKGWSAAQREQVRLLGQQLNADPSLARDPQKAMERVKQLSASLSLAPADVMTVLRSGGQSLTGGQQAPSDDDRQASYVFPKGPHAGKAMILLPNGKYRVVPGQ